MGSGEKEAKPEIRGRGGRLERMGITGREGQREIWELQVLKEIRGKREELEQPVLQVLLEPWWREKRFLDPPDQLVWME